MTKILQSIPYPTYTTAERDLLVDVLKNTLINNSDTSKVEEYDGVNWNAIGGDITVDTMLTDGSANPIANNAVFDALNTKVDKNTTIIGATKTKVTYDAKGLVTSGEDATTADIADSTDKRYVTEAEKVDIAKIDGIEAQISANQLTFASIYGYYNFI